VELLLAVSHAESGFNPNALNVAGRPVFPSSRFEAERILKRAGENVDGGLMQINWRIWNKKIGLSKADFLDPALNVLLESKILSHSVHTKKLPTLIDKSIKFIFNFEVSKKVSLLVILALLAIYVAFSFHELLEPEQWPDFSNIECAMDGWPFENICGKPPFHYHVKNALFFVSQNFFHNIKLVPFIGSISLVFFTYLFTVQITKKRFAGLVSMSILLSSQMFLLYDTTPTYSNYWTLFYLLSLYLITKRWQFSSVSEL